MPVLWAQNFTKKASGYDSGTYTCVAGIGQVVKKSNAVQIVVCGEYVLASSESVEIEWEKRNFSPAATLLSLTVGQTKAGDKLAGKKRGVKSRLNRSKWVDICWSTGGRQRKENIVGKSQVRDFIVAGEVASDLARFWLLGQAPVQG